ncbi:beta-1,3-N-acetylglucosaminyltransferase lunatic fringe-like [Acanthaster planci]|uniref:Beta-1,3-N-acetylglucosaminyltransferase lunatic fringe-like n=1 Tax=Acanthaster planci TaxID=133434 RepID=A0A8B7YSA6_ACAPL|nr:beta-1,3-N-acetylglucosaminyltransferase lunatic fringe-like [Acanthaster planci]
MYYRWQRMSSLKPRTVLMMGTVYVMLCFVAVLLLLPSDAEEKENRSSKIQALQVEAWQGSSKRGGRPRNIFFSSEGREDDLVQPARVESHSSLGRKTFNTSRYVPVQNKSFIPSNPTTFENSFRQTELSDIFIGVKTTEIYHDTRLPVLFETWLDGADVRKQTYFFTDADSPKYSKETDGHFINTHCAARHTRQGLCCKMGHIFSTYLQSGKRWWCNVDDDNYLNIGNLLKLLRSYRHDKDYYLGRSSTSSEITVYDVGDKRNLGKKKVNEPRPPRRQTSFWFATGGAGVCISRSLAVKMSTYAGMNEFPHICNRINLPDDVSIAFIIVDILGIPLTKIGDMHSHLAVLRNLHENQVKNAVTLSYRMHSEKAVNSVMLKSAAFNTTVDPTRFKSIHCLLHPEAGICPGA